MKKDNTNDNIEQFDVETFSTPVETVGVALNSSTQASKVAVESSVPVAEAPVKLINENSMQGSEVIKNASLPSEETIKKKKFSVVLIIILGIVVVVATTIVVLKFLSGDPVKVFSSALDLGYNKVSESMKTAEQYTMKYFGENPIKLSGNIKLNSNIPMLNEYTKYTFGYNLGLDLTGEKLEVGMSLSEGNTKILDGIVYMISNNLYMKSEQLYDKIIYSKSEDSTNESATFEIDVSAMNTENIYSDTDVLLKKTIEYIKDSFSKDDFTKEKSAIKIDGNDVNVTKINYIVDKDEAFELYKTVINGYKSDDEIIGILANILGEEKETISTNLANIDLETNSFEKMKTLNVSIYTKGFLNDVVGFSIAEENREVLSFVTKDTKSELNMKYDNIVIDAVSQNGTTTGNVSQDGTKILSFKITESKEEKTVKNNLEFDYTMGTTALTFKLNTSMTIESEVKENAVIEFEVNSISEGETITLGGNITNNIEIGGKVAEVDVSGAVKVESLSEDEQKEIFDNLSKALENTPFYELLGLDAVMKQEYVMDGTSLASSVELYAGENMGDASEKCVNIDELVLLGYSAIDTTKYDGKVVIDNSNGKFSYTIYLTDNEYMINGVEVNDYTFGISEMDVEEYVVGQINLECSAT